MTRADVTYSGYLKIPELLELQQPKTEPLEHDDRVVRRHLTVTRGRLTGTACDEARRKYKHYTSHSPLLSLDTVLQTHGCYSSVSR